MNYMQAISAAIQATKFVADGIKFLVDHSEDIAKSMKDLTTMLDAAKDLMVKAVDLVPIDELLNRANADDADQVDGREQQEVVEDDQPHIKVPGFLTKAKDAVADFADEQKTSFERMRLEQDMVKAVHESRRKVLESATVTFSIKQLAEQLISTNEGEAIAGLGVLDLPGCFAIARYGKMEFGKDPAAFTGIYIGKDSCVGEGLARTIAPTGNADVYADVKYKQNVIVYVFTWPADKLDEKYEALIQLFAAGESYNRVEMGVTDEELVAE